MEISFANDRRELKHRVAEIEETEINLRFQLATNGIVCIADANEDPMILTNAVKF